MTSEWVISQNGSLTIGRVSTVEIRGSSLGPKISELIENIQPLLGFLS